MTGTEISALVAAQRAFFDTGTTRAVSYRLEALKRLRQAVTDLEGELTAALKEDLGKSWSEGYMCEIGMTLSELTYLIRHTPAFARPRRKRTPLSQFHARSYVQPDPYGVALIMSPWNYPVLLTLEPLADALAAGNTAILKPSAYAPAVSRVLRQVVERCFPPEYVAVVEGGRQENQDLLKEKFDTIFFTGSQSVGRTVMRAAAEHLTPVTLELGGKSPCIVDETADLAVAARRIVFGKYLNCGQTCVAPDYLWCHASVKETLKEAIFREIKAQFGDRPLENPDYGKIINQKHFERLLGLIQPEKVVWGGKAESESLRIEPTVMDGVTWEDKVMGEEIFGPILPILTYTDLDQVISDLERKSHPLALYLFSADKGNQRKVTGRCRYGGGCINDTIVHLATSEMGFGGVGESGMGAYHGRTGFDAFSHHKSILDQKTWLDLPLRYQPYEKKREGMLRFFLR